MTKRLLLVDDDTAVLFAYKKIFQRERFKVDATTSKNDSYLLLSRNRYDVAILDVCLGDKSSEGGFELLRHIKGTHPETVTIMITANGDREVIERANKLGTNYFFEKPVSTGCLRQALVFSGILDSTDFAE